MSKSNVLSFVSMSAFLLIFTTAPAEATPNSDFFIIVAVDSMKVAPDNSANNKGGLSSQELTADQGGNMMNDRDIMQKIRQSVIADKSLSTYAQNIKIISQNGKVTLKGPVQSDKEKQTIDAKAATIAGDRNVSDELTVMPAK